ncbi:hypothetical protein V8E55_008236 [Tylopilus felleus]
MSAVDLAPRGHLQEIGSSIALRLARDGFDIALNDVASKREQLRVVAEDIQKIGRRTAYVKEMVQEVAKRLGGLDVMIANTGIARIAPLVSTDLEDWAQVMGTDLSFVTNMQHNRRLNKGGRIVSASATLGRAGGPMTVAYCVSKFAVRDLTQTAEGIEDLELTTTFTVTHSVELMSDAKGVALITGSAQDIGRSITLRLARDGFDIALNDVPSKCDQLRAVADEIEKIGRRTALVPADVSVDREVKGIIQDVAKELGARDVLVANSGVLGLSSLIATEVEEWERVMAVNTCGTFLCY